MVFLTLKKLASNAWDGLRQVPGWLVFVVLVAFATLAYLYRRQVLLVRVAEIRREEMDIERELAVRRKDAAGRADARVDAAEVALKKRVKEITEVKLKINAQRAEGITGLADAWNERIRRRRKS
jgi:hypothetical protein